MLNHNFLSYPKAENIAPKLENTNLSFIAQNHSSVTTLKRYVYRWQMNIIT